MMRTRSLVVGALVAAVLVSVVATSSVVGAEEPVVLTPVVGFELISVAADGGPANGVSGSEAISVDGRFVGFSSLASNLVPGDTNGLFDVFLRDRLNQTTVRVNLTSEGEQFIDGGGSTVAVSSDGSKVVFAGTSSQLNDGPLIQLYVKDLITGELSLVTRGVDGFPANAVVLGARASADGSKVVFVSGADNLVPGDNNDRDDVFLADIESGTIERVSAAKDGSELDVDAVSPVISGDGTTVAYVARFPSGRVVVVDLSTNERSEPLVGVPSRYRFNETGQYLAYSPDSDRIVVLDRATGLTEDVSLTNDGERPNGSVSLVSMSADGRYVMISSGTVTNYDDEGIGGVFIRDRAADRIYRFGYDTDGEPALFGGPSSRDMTVMAFTARRGPLVDIDTNDVNDIYVVELGNVCYGRLATIAGSGTLHGTDEADVIVGSSGTDVIRAGAGDDLICGLGGNDQLVGDAGDDIIDGGPGNDDHAGGPGADLLLAGFGNDRFRGGPGIDDVDYTWATTGVTVSIDNIAGDGPIDENDDVWTSVENVTGSAFDDVLTGSSQPNVLVGGPGNDRARGRGGNDHLTGGPGFDRLQGDDGNDTLSGGQRADRLIGGPGDDLLLGEQGNDILIGGPGNDTLNANGGSLDYCRGSAGTDTYLSCETADP